MPQLFLSCFPGSGREEQSSLPDTILTAGRPQRDRQVEGGVPAERIAVGGSARFAEIVSWKPALRRAKSSDRDTRVLVAVAHSVTMTRALLHALDRQFGDFESRRGLEFHFRPHPTLPKVRRFRAEWMKEVAGDLTTQLSTFDVLIATGTNVAIEARLLGIPVIIFKAEAEIDMDPTDILPAQYFLYASGADLRNCVQAAAIDGVLPVPEDLRAHAADIFPPLNLEAWLRVLPEARTQSARKRAVAEPRV